MNAQRTRDRARSLRTNRVQRVIALPPRIKMRKYPIWSVKTVTIVSLLLTAIVAAVVLGFGKRSLLVEAEWIAVVVAACLFVFLFVGLYRGIRVKKTEAAPTNFEFINVDAADLGVGDLGWADGIDGDWPMLILAPVLFILFGVLLIFLLPVLVNLVWLLLFVFVVMLFWIFRYALRQVFARSRQTRGQLAGSLYYAAIYTAIYSGWLLVVLITARQFVE